MGVPAAARLLRTWLRAWGVVFSLGALDFLFLPGQTVAALDEAGHRLGFASPTPVAAGFWVPLAAAYMTLVSAFCWDAQRSPRPHAAPVRYLVLAKLASAGFALGWFLFAARELPFLAAGVLDALIAAGTIALLRAARPPPA